VAQGGDWGNAVSEVMALQQPPGLLGIHTNMAATVPANISRALAFHEAPPADLTAEERNRVDQLVDFYGKGARVRPRNVEPPANALRYRGFRRSGSPRG